jgi:hypothetical protein
VIAGNGLSVLFLADLKAAGRDRQHRVAMRPSMDGWEVTVADRPILLTNSLRVFG